MKLHEIWLSVALTSSSLLGAGSISMGTEDKLTGGKPVQSEMTQGIDQDTLPRLYPREIVRGKRWRWRSSAFTTPCTKWAFNSQNLTIPQTPDDGQTSRTNGTT
jgi:hypothetical protein